MADLIATLVFPYTLFGLFTNLYCHDYDRRMWGRWARNAPTKDAKVFINVVCGILWLPTTVLYCTYRFLKGGFDLLPKRKPKSELPEARVIR